MKAPAGDSAAPPELDIILEPGDFLFVPAGYRHRCENQDERSLHTGIFFWPLTVPRIFTLQRGAAIDDPAQRRPLPARAEGAADEEATLKDALIAQIRGLSLAEPTRAPPRDQAGDLTRRQGLLQPSGRLCEGRRR
ncbi:MAG: cupin domain-containing protein [Sphingomonas sp.]